ncbi:MAG TPA: ATP-binding protein [Candidatus Eisenbacteria bacterium]|jgi:lon-related putative ATP-dependent protease|nr:ATP-binding protein [Candidatus Eisenbacteria bacterium]
MASASPLPVEALRRVCDASQFAFSTTAELEPLEDTLGQARALEAMRFGVGVRHRSYNLFAFGPPGTGKHTTVLQYLKRQAQQEEVPSDWVYVNNFKDPHRPRAVRLPAGRGKKFCDDMEKLIEELRASIPATFESEAFRQRKQSLSNEFEHQQEQAFDELREQAKEKGIALLRTPLGLSFAPVRGEEVIDPEEFSKLGEVEQKRIQKDVEALQERLQQVLQQVPRWEREHRQRLRDLRREVTRFAAVHLMEELRTQYVDLPEVIEYLDEVLEDIVENAAQFVQQASGPGQQQETPPGLPQPMPPGAAPGPGRRYQVNLLVDRSALTGAPVVYADQPSYADLVGRVEHVSQFGALVTDFTLVKPGALHRANGGYLVLDAMKVFSQPFSWDTLKRALRAGEIRIETLAEKMNLVSTVSLEPEPIPLSTKVVLVGDRRLYYMVSAADPEFDELFKVAVDFDDRLDRTNTAVEQYARLIASLAQRENLKPLDASAVARVIEESSRLCADAHKLSTRTSSLMQLLRESDYWAGEAQRTVVTSADVDRAIGAYMRRGDYIRERMQEEIRRGTILIDVEGEREGQVNGLSVVDYGGRLFGRPNRITARVRFGKGEVVDIEREVALGGPLHSKGVLILEGYLGERFAHERPLAFSASLVFEQSYGGVDGDSASSAELYALLSALSGLPLRQSLAVTGSVNQHGHVQAIGGVNEKIEGFFDVCSQFGLTGDQGVLIPAANVQHLMLRNEVVRAAAEGRFHIYPIETIDQGIEILTGVPAGERNGDGTYPQGSVNARVEERLAHLFERAKSFAAAVRAEKLE